MKWLKIEEIAVLIAIVAMIVAFVDFLSGCSGNSPSFDVLGEEGDAGGETDQTCIETDESGDQSEESGDSETEETDPDTDSETETYDCNCKPEQDINFSCDVFNDLNPPQLVHNWALDDQCPEGEICCQPADVVGDYCLDLNRECVTGFDKCSFPDLEGYCYTSGNVCCKRVNYDEDHKITN